MSLKAPTGSVCIVDDDDQVRRFLMEVFSSVGMSVAAFASGESFIRDWAPVGPSCVLLDLRMPAMDGAEVHDVLRSRHRHVPVIFLTGYADVQTAVGAMRLGAFDFIEKPFNIQLLIERVQEALRKSALHPAEHALDMSWMSSLTPREREVLDFLVAGLRTKAIAQELEISERTVETHRANIMQKSGTHSVTELVASVLSHSRP